MEDQSKEKTGSYAAVPKFGGWESATMPTDYSMVFATAREQKKTGVKIEIPTDNKGNKVSDDEVKGHLISRSHDTHTHKRTWVDRYFTCCINAA
ncbi:hypothetical protein SUGI_1085090 [Cryptomeria japonica]|uniref:uncharacterized protein LOC131076182 n=1 Tax=Cryptomeria japonica TaxID=3369 RepID=UPI00241479AF|nr:uncharacterized protein LOC131076182 [Cryptomeria japonica]GLJ50950.1 hypothetical protein SUGI_1085090 [Cryptomeria japonica]